MRLIMFGINSKTTMRQVGSPATFAAMTKSRLRSVSAWARRMRASKAHSVRPRIRIMSSRAAVLEVGRGDDQQRDRGDHEEHVGREVDDVVDPAAAVGGQDAEARREHRRERGRGGAEEERVARAPGRPARRRRCPGRWCRRSGSRRATASRPAASTPSGRASRAAARRSPLRPCRRAMISPMRDFGLPSSRRSHSGKPGSRRRRAAGTCCTVSGTPRSGPPRRP